jgi:peptidoglycan/xylan/chitin deacetylase (PgdA/CDA1 family)
VAVPAQPTRDEDNEVPGSVSRRLFIGGAGLAALGAQGCSAPRSARAGGTRSSADETPSTAPSSAAPHPRTTTSATTNQDEPDLLHGPRTRRAVALTFHGQGAVALTEAALRHAARARAGLTVMAVGSWLEQNPSLAARIVDAGHDLGNHTWSHQQMPSLGRTQARVEVERAADLLRRLTGSSGVWFRPSGTPRSTATIRAAARAAGYRRCLAYDVDPLDYQDPGPDVVTGRVLAGAAPGSIVSLHLGHAGTVAALPAILQGLQDKGLRVVTMSALMAGQS